MKITIIGSGYVGLPEEVKRHGFTYVGVGYPQLRVASATGSVKDAVAPDLFRAKNRVARA